MPKRSRREPAVKPARPKRRRTATIRQPERDANQTAFDAVQRLIELSEGTGGKNPLAVVLGRRGGLKGGKARAKRLTASERSESARRAANARWEKQ